MKPLRVAIFTGEFPVLSETFVIRQISGLLDQGVDVTIIAGQQGDYAVLHELFVRHCMAERVKYVRKSMGGAEKLLSVCRFLLCSPLSRRGWLQLRSAFSAISKGNSPSIVDIAERYTLRGEDQHLGDYDAIIAHFGQNGVRTLRLREAGLISGPLATIFHGFDMSNLLHLKKWRPSYSELFDKTEMLLPISDLWKCRLTGWGAPPEKIRVLRMGVDVNHFRVSESDRDVKMPLRVLSVARLTEKKGISYAVDGVRNAQASIHYKIIGAGPLLGALEARSLNLPPGKTIEFLGKKAQKDVFSELENTDVFLLPSVTASDGDMEGIPVSIMEAMAKGVVVLATRHSGVPELVEDGKTGFLVAERSTEEISRKLDLIASNGSMLPVIRQAAREKVESDFNNVRLDVELLGIIEAMAKN
jgi:colanic acid/amylovoran biosynthesis glycosyltransferase